MTVAIDVYFIKTADINKKLHACALNSGSVVWYLQTHKKR